MGSAPSPRLPIARLAGIGLIIFLANAALLVLQLVAGRLLAPYIGSSLETWTSIIGVFLLGIALGNAYGGRLADRYPSPRTLAALLAAGAIAAVWMAIFPSLLAATGAYKSLGLVARIPLLALVLCLPAGFVLSLLTPLAIKLGLPDVAHTGRVAGMVFALSTLGCLLGNYLAGFVLIPAFAINSLVYFAAGSLAVLSAGTVLFLREAGGQPEPVAERLASTPREATTHGNATDTFSDIRLAYLVVFLASFCGMTLELTASRVLAEYLGVSLFTWTGIIGVMLAGTACGNFTGGILADRASQPGALRRPLACLAAIGTGLLSFGLAYSVIPWVCDSLGAPLGLPDESLLLIGVISTIVLAFGAYILVVRSVPESIPPRVMLGVTLICGGAGTILMFVIRPILTNSLPFEDLHPITQVMGWTFSLFFLPMFVLGMVSPQVIRLSVPDVAHVGRVAGRVYAWSTTGAIFGTFASGYFLLSTFGMNRTLLGVALVLTLTSLLVAKVWEKNQLLYLFSIVLGGVTGGFILTARGDRDQYLIAKVETNYYTIKVMERLNMLGRPTGVRVLYLDALIHSEVDPDNPGFLRYTHEHIQIEFLWAARAGTPNPRVVVIGGGGYTFPRYAMGILPETRMDVVEIDPGVTKVAYQHLGLQHYEGLNIIHMDGRQFIAEKAVPGSYDLVVQDAVNDLSVPSHLLTKEYNDAVKRTLRPDGTYLLTVIDSLKYGKLWRASMRTLRETFAHVELISSDSVPPLTPPPGADEEALKKWKRDLRRFETERQVLVIYAADRPLDEERVRTIAYQHLGLAGHAAQGAAIGAAGGGAIGATMGAAERLMAAMATYTHTIPAERLKPFLAEDPGVLLTDQFAPVDNLMADVFRYRTRARPGLEPDE